MSGGPARPERQHVNKPRLLLLFAPDEHASNRLEAVFEVTGRRWRLPTEPADSPAAPTPKARAPRKPKPDSTPAGNE